jgi:hypothetical protein
MNLKLIIPEPLKEYLSDKGKQLYIGYFYVPVG